MAKVLHEYSNVDIYTYPHNRFPSQLEVTIGDLHGNPIKLLNFLIQAGVVDFKEDKEENYRKLAKLYESHMEAINRAVLIGTPAIEANTQILRQQIADFSAMIEHLNVIDDSPLIRLIGDVFADRGANDLLTIKVLNRFFKQGLNFKTCLSNHDSDFITTYEDAIKEDPIVFESMNLVNPNPSLHNLEYCIDIGLVDFTEIQDFCDNYYLPSLKAIDFSLSDEGITLYTHAPVGFDAIKYTAEKLAIEYDDSSAETLAATIDKINEQFHVYVAEGRIHELVGVSQVAPENMSVTQQKAKPFMHLIWNRWNDLKEITNLRIREKNGYQISYVHGHDSYQSSDEFAYNVDTHIGKVSQVEANTNKKYKKMKVLTSDEKILDYELTSTEETVDETIDPDELHQELSDIVRRYCTKNSPFSLTKSAEALSKAQAFIRELSAKQDSAEMIAATLQHLYEAQQHAYKYEVLGYIEVLYDINAGDDSYQHRVLHLAEAANVELDIRPVSKRPRK